MIRVLVTETSDHKRQPFKLLEFYSPNSMSITVVTEASEEILCVVCGHFTRLS